MFDEKINIAKRLMEDKTMITEKHGGASQQSFVDLILRT
jgi:hypothetical protein